MINKYEVWYPKCYRKGKLKTLNIKTIILPSKMIFDSSIPKKEQARLRKAFKNTKVKIWGQKPLMKVDNKMVNEKLAQDICKVRYIMNENGITVSYKDLAKFFKTSQYQINKLIKYHHKAIKSMTDKIGG